MLYYIVALLIWGSMGIISLGRNGRLGDAFVQERLDRACATVDWRELFPHSKVTHLHVAYSNHVPILLTTQGLTHSTRRKKIPKRFEEKWASHPECEQIIWEAWNGTNPTGSPMFRLFEKIKKCRMALVGWSRNMGSVRENIDGKYRELEALVEMNSANNIDQINRVRGEINALLLQDELFWRQRSRAIWLPAGDKNTKYFHQRANQRRRKNQITGFTDENGRWCTSDNEIARVAESYFQNLFSSANTSNMESVLETVDRVVTPDMNDTLLQPYTLVEVKQALFQMQPSKAPGPDGMSLFFFQKYWHIVGCDVTEAVLSVLHSRHLLHKMNYTHIVLIPKKNDPKLVSDFRPISLGNVVCRIISKVLANHLKIIFSNVISDSQSVFVPQRLITDNTAVAYEILHKMRNKRRGKKG